MTFRPHTRALAIALAITLAGASCLGTSLGAQSVDEPFTIARVKFERGIKASALEHRLAALAAFAKRGGGRVARALDRALASVQRELETLDRVRARSRSSKKRVRATRRAREQRTLEAALIRAITGVGTALDGREGDEARGRIEAVVRDAIDAPSAIVRDAAIRAWIELDRSDALPIALMWLDRRLAAVRARRAGGVPDGESGDALAPHRALRLDESSVASLRGAVGALFARLDSTGRTTLLREMRERFDGASDTQTRVETIETIGFLDAPAAETLAREAASAAEPEVRMVAVEALGRQRRATVVLPLAKALGDRCWQVAAVAVDALERVGGSTAVGVLVDALSEAEGRLRTDVNRALATLTGEDFHENGPRWRQWWRANRATYRGRPAIADPDAIAAGRKRSWMNRTRGVAFYGIATSSKRVVYILDISGSMNERATRAETVASDGDADPEPRRIDAAIAALDRSITALDDDATFNIVFYQTTVVSWRTEQVAATPANRDAARKWARGIVARGGTNLFGAIEHAFALSGRSTLDARFPTAADTFFVLSDGQPTVGLVDADAIVDAVRRLNRFRRVCIHTIAVGEGADAPFLARLAEATGGLTRVVRR